ncbi:MAG: hypothetical protein ACKVJG_23105 [Candidatus Latescibacterota bacterium]|jgi:nitrogen fixation/metabolism regulation signal transduction histidine kinase
MTRDAQQRMAEPAADQALVFTKQQAIYERYFIGLALVLLLAAVFYATRRISASITQLDSAAQAIAAGHTRLLP